MITREQVSQMNETAATFQAYWQSLIPEYTPHLSQFTFWLSKFWPEHVELAINRTVAKARKQRAAAAPMDAGWLVKYASKVMQNKRFEEGNKIPELDWSEGVRRD